MPTEEQRKKRQRIRLGPDNLPIFIIEDQIKKFCHREIKVQTEDGDVEIIKMRTTGLFLQELNSRVFDLVNQCIQNAFGDNERTNLVETDIPPLNGGED